MLAASADASEPVGSDRGVVGAATDLRQPSSIAHADNGRISVVFTIPGSLGLKLTPRTDSAGTCTVINRIKPGTQAEQHPQLRTGLVVETVAGQLVSDKSHAGKPRQISPFAGSLVRCAQCGGLRD